jgi:hypothetical protein
MSRCSSVSLRSSNCFPWSKIGHAVVVQTGCASSAKSVERAMTEGWYVYESCPDLDNRTTNVSKDSATYAAIWQGMTTALRKLSTDRKKRESLYRWVWITRQQLYSQYDRD